VPSLVRTVARRPAAVVVFLTVPDGAVANVAAEIAALDSDVPSTVSFIHTSGALGLAALDALRKRHDVGSFHPLRSFPEPLAPDAFKGIVVAVDASNQALRRRLAALARDLHARSRHVDDSRRAEYHAAAVFASNYVVALLGVAVGMLEEIGWSEADAVKGLTGLAQGALRNVAKQGPTAALTGPIRRGDADTVARHIEALSGAAQGAGESTRRADLYRMLGAIALEIAREAGLEPAAAERVRRALTRDVAATRRRRRR
jgi:predicted short-subunit dehydrogenase-like oxidoreductase (DUF2520 family)